MARILFEDIFEVLEKDPDGKAFDKGTSLDRAAPFHNSRLVGAC